MSNFFNNLLVRLGVILDYVIFLLGVNTPDHSVLYSNVVTHIQEKVTPYVALLQSRTKANSLKHIMQSIASQLSEIDETGDCTDLPTSQCTLSHIEKWYTRVECKTSSPRVCSFYYVCVLVVCRVILDCHYWNCAVIKIFLFF